MWNEFVKIGRLAWQQGLFSSHGGNMSVRVGDRILITRRGSMLGSLEKEDVIETSLFSNDTHITLASTEIIVHRAIYKSTSALAVFHAHPPCAVALSMLCSEIVLEDSEGSYILKKVPVVQTALTVGAKEVAEAIPAYLNDFKVVMLKGHGSFAVGTLLEEAFSLTSSLEHSCRISHYMRAFTGEKDKTCPW
jgi:L-fuculose-phosphate aldolase